MPPFQDTSEKVHRKFKEERTQVVPRTQVQTVNGRCKLVICSFNIHTGPSPGVVPPGTIIRGISVELQDGYNDDAKRTINGAMDMIARIVNPFNDDHLVSHRREGEEGEDGAVTHEMADAIQIDEDEITLADTSSLLSQYAPFSGVDEDNRTSVASSKLPQSHPSSPQTTTNIHYNIIHNSIIATNSSHLTGITANTGEQLSGG